MNKSIGIEVGWVILVGFTTILLIGFLTHFNFFINNTVDIQLHDTYVVLDFWNSFIIIFLNLCFWFFLLRQLKYKFESKTLNYFQLTLTGLLILYFPIVYSILQFTFLYYFTLLYHSIQIFVLAKVAISIGHQIKS